MRAAVSKLASLQVGSARGSQPSGAPGARRAHFRKGGPWKATAFMAAAAVAVGLGSACGGDPPQIVDYAPQRNTVDVSTAAPIRITFDHDVDQASVNSRLHLVPSTQCIVRWIDG